MPDAMQWEDRIVQTELGGRILNDALPAPLQRLAPGTAVRVTVEPLTPPIAAGGGTERCSTCGGPVMRCECCTTPGFDTPPASAPGGADEWWEAAECEAWAQARQHASEIGWRDLDKAESIAAAATGSLRFAILAAVRRAAEQGRQQVVALIVTANTQAIPHHSADWMNGFAAGQRAMRSAVATGLAALTASAKGGEG